MNWVFMLNLGFKGHDQGDENPWFKFSVMECTSAESINNMISMSSNQRTLKTQKQKLTIQSDYNKRGPDTY